MGRIMLGIGISNPKIGRMVSAKKPVYLKNTKMITQAATVMKSAVLR